MRNYNQALMMTIVIVIITRIIIMVGNSYYMLAPVLSTLCALTHFLLGVPREVRTVIFP